MGKFLDPLELEYLDGRNWKVIAEFDYITDVLPAEMTLHIPAGFQTDFASVPEILWNILPPTGKYGKAAVVHDYIYRGNVKGVFTRAQADSVFKEAMGVLGVSTFVKNIMYAGVRIGGWKAWNG